MALLGSLFFAMLNLSSGRPSTEGQWTDMPCREGTIVNVIEHGRRLGEQLGFSKTTVCEDGIMGVTS